MKLIINNKSDLPIDTVLEMVKKVLAKGEQVVFNDYKGSNGKHYTCVWEPNKESERYTIYNQPNN